MSEAFGAENETKAWLAFAAMKVTSYIIEITASAPPQVRQVMSHPSQVDLALVSRVADLLTDRSTRLADERNAPTPLPGLVGLSI